MSLPIFLNQVSTVGQWMTGTLSLVSLEVTVFALIVWLILRLVRFRSAKVREGFWLTVLFKMVFSLFLAWPISWFIIPGQRATSEDILATSAPPVEQITQQPDNGTSAVIPLTETSTPSQVEHSRNGAVLLVDEVAWWHHLNWRDSPYCGRSDAG